MVTRNPRICFSRAAASGAATASESRAESPSPSPTAAASDDHRRGPAPGPTVLGKKYWHAGPLTAQSPPAAASAAAPPPMPVGRARALGSWIARRRGQPGCQCGRQAERRDRGTHIWVRRFLKVMKYLHREFYTLKTFGPLK